MIFMTWKEVEVSTLVFPSVVTAPSVIFPNSEGTNSWTSTSSAAAAIALEH
jgi:hypothetical protein